MAAGWHITQGTSHVAFADLWSWLTGGGVDDRTTETILFGSRLPRMGAGVAVGVSLGVAGALLQSLARNPLASPDTLAVTAGGYFAVTAIAAFGVSVPLWASGATAAAGGLAAAGVVLGLSGSGTSTTRLILAGSAVAMALQSATAALLILFETETTALFSWGSGSLSQLGMEAFTRAAPVVIVSTAAAMLLSRRLDLLSLGEDTAAVMGVPVRSTRVIATIVAVVLTAASVTLAGPIGFVGLFAPVLVRLLGAVAPGLLRHAALIPAAGLMGAIVVLFADIALRALIGASSAVFVPTGVTTTFLGALFIVVLARGLRESAATREPPAAGLVVRSRRRFFVVLGFGAVLVVAVAVGGLLLGYTKLRTGDIGGWLAGDAPRQIAAALDERAPRVAAALIAGAALALSGSIVQATCRNPLADPGILGISAGAGLAAVIGVTLLDVGTAGLLALAVVGALVAFALVYSLSWKGGLNSDRLVLIGIGVGFTASSVSTFLLVRANSWDTPRIYTWLSGTTYGRTWIQVLPVLVLLVIAVPIALSSRRELDLFALDDDAPRLAGVRLEPARLAVLVIAALLAATSVLAVGVVGFVGLVAPHAARALVGPHHIRSVPVAMLFGAVLLGVADVAGRTLIAPAQLPAGLMVAAIGAPYFIYLLRTTRA